MDELAQARAAGRQEQATDDLLQVPREIDFRLRMAMETGAFQARWNSIVQKAERDGSTGPEVLLIAASALCVDFSELLRAVLAEREKATAVLLQK